MDHLFSVDFERKMRDLALRTLEIGKKRVLVYRFFEIEEEESVARYLGQKYGGEGLL